MNLPKNISERQLDSMLKMASQRLGRSPQELREQLQSGDLNKVGINEQQQQQIGQLLKDPQALTQFMQQPQIKEILDNLMKGR